jgi:hypothetical protein
MLDFFFTEKRRLSQTQRFFVLKEVLTRYRSKMEKVYSKGKATFQVVYQMPMVERK